MNVPLTTVLYPSKIKKEGIIWCTSLYIMKDSSYKSYKISPFRTPGAIHELYFYNAVTSPWGRVVASGMAKGTKLNNWWNTAHAKKQGQHYSLVMMLENSVGFYSNARGFECSLKWGNFFIEFPGQKHRYAPGLDEAWGELCVEFEGEIFDSMLKEKVLSINSSVWCLKNPEHWFLRLQEMLQRPRAASTLGAAREVMAFSAFLLEMIEAAQPQKPSSVPDDWFDRACVLLSRDLSRPLDLRAVAEELEMSYEYFRINFRQLAAMPPGKYRDQQRYKAACERLINTHEPCWEIALYLGFCDEQHFSRRFKQWAGLPPQIYRARHKAKKR